MLQVECYPMVVCIKVFFWLDSLQKQRGFLTKTRHMNNYIGFVIHLYGLLYSQGYIGWSELKLRGCWASVYLYIWKFQNDQVKIYAMP